MLTATVRADHPSQLQTLQTSALPKYRLCLCQSRRGQLLHPLRPDRCGGEHAVAEGAVMDAAAVVAEEDTVIAEEAVTKGAVIGGEHAA